MVKCKECGNEFTEGDTISECSSCDEIVCENCEEKHKENNCQDIGYDSHNNESCESCGGCEEEMYECDCGQFYCSGCWDEHVDNHKDDIKFTSHNYKDYIEEKVKEEL